MEHSELQTIAILPEEHHVVVNDLVFNTSAKTYGSVPGFTMYEEYYKNAKEHPYERVDDILVNANIPLNEHDLWGMIELMRETELVDVIRIVPEDGSALQILFRTDVSARWGEKGILYSSDELMNTVTDDFSRTKIDEGYYLFLSQ